MTVYSHSRVTTVTTIRRIRRLPRGSVHHVTPSQPVKALDVIASLELPGAIRVLRVAQRLHVAPAKVEVYLRKRVGDHMEKGEVLAERKGLARRRMLCPMDGTIVQITDGQVIIEGERPRQEIYATVPGKVTAIEPGHHVAIETTAALIQLAWGHGDFAWGTLRVLDTAPGLATDPARFTIDHRGAIVAIGSPLTEDFLKGAADIRVKALIASSMHSTLIPLVRQVEFPVGLTQGFGITPMSERVLSLLGTYNGREIAVDMASIADWRESRPEIIIPVSTQAPEDRPLIQPAFMVGQKVRILQSPYRGEIGTLAALPSGPRITDSGLWLTGGEVETPDGRNVFVPFANLENLG